MKICENELKKAIESYSSYFVNGKSKYQNLLDSINENKDKIKISDEMFEIVAKKGDFKAKEKKLQKF